MRGNKMLSEDLLFCWNINTNVKYVKNTNMIVTLAQKTFYLDTMAAAEDELFGSAT